MSFLGFESWQWLTAILTSLPIIYWYLTKNLNYWTKRGIKGPKPKIIFGNLLEKISAPTPLVELDWFNQYGKLYGVFLGNEPVLTIADPELIKIVMVKDFNLFSNRRPLKTFHPILNINLFNSRDEDWKRYRSLSSPAFTSGKMKKMYPMIKDCLNIFITHLESYAESGKEMNIKDLTENFTMDVIASCAFATKTNANQEPNNPVVMNGKKIFDFKAYRFVPAFVFPLFINKLLNIKSAADESANQFFFDLTRHVIKNRQNSNAKYDDFIQLMINAKDLENKETDELDDNENHYVIEGNEMSEQKFLNSSSTLKQMNENEILAQAWIFFIAGFETTATTLSFCKYELAVNPECQETLYEEVSSAVDSNGEISYEKLAKLPYLDAVIAETLRKYPPVLRLEREVGIIDYKLGNTGITLYKGQIVELPVYAMHHCEEYYPNPEKFIPERFLPENRHQIIPYTYLPFGSGPRNCIGMRFALMEAKLALFHIIRQLEFVKSVNTEIPLRFKQMSPLCAAESIKIGIKKRC